MIDKSTVEKVAVLAKLRFSEEEKLDMIQDMNNILTHIDKLSEVNTEGVEPLIFLTEEINSFREDIPSVTITKEEALKNAPAKDSDYFKVPKFIERD